MLKTFKLKTLFLLLSMIVGIGNAWGTEITDVLNRALTGVTNTTYAEWSGKKSNSDAVYAGNSAGGNESIQLRSNSSNSGIITTASGGKVTKITVTWNSNTQDGRTLNVYGTNSAYSATTDLYDTQKQGTLIGTIVKGSSTVLAISDEYEFIGLRSASGAMYLTEIDIIWETSTDSRSATTVTIDASGITNTNVFNGTAAGSLSATVKTADGGPISGASVTWESDNTDVATINAQGVVTLVAAGTATLKASYAGDNNFKPSSDTYTLVVTNENPNQVDNISDITAAGTYTVKGTIVAKSTRGFIVGDGTGYVYYYNTNYTQADYNIGDKVKLAGSVIVYGGVFEFNKETAISAVDESNFVEEEPTVLTGADMDTRVGSTTPALSNYVEYQGKLTVDGTHYNITNIDGATTAIGSISFPINTDFASLDGKTVIVKGYYVGISSSTYYNTMIGSIEEVVSTEPAISVSPVTVNASADGGDGTLTVTYENIATINAEVFFCDAEGEAAAYNWINAEINGENNVSYEIEANTGEARTAYLKVYERSSQLYSNLVTITQAAYVLEYTALPFIWEGGKKSDLLAKYGVTANGLGSDYGDNNAPYLIKFDGTGDYIQVRTDSRPGKVTIGVKMIGGAETSTITVQGSADGETFTDVEELTISGSTNSILNLESTNDFAATDRYVRLLFTKGSNVGVGPITIAAYSSTPSITLSPSTVEATSATTEGIINMAYKNMGDQPLFEILFCDANGDQVDAGNYSWIQTSLREMAIEYTIAENTFNESRTAYLKVYGTDGNNDVYSNIVTITQAAYEFVSLPFAFDGGKADIAETIGLSQEGLGSDYGSSPKLKFDDTGDWLLLKFKDEPGVLTFDIKGNSFSGGTFTVQCSTDGEEFVDLDTFTEDRLKGLSSATTCSYDIDADVRYIKWIYTEKVNGNVALGNIHLYKPNATEDITVSSAGWCTYVTKAPLLFEEGKAFVVIAIGATSITYQNVIVVEAKTPIMVKGTEGSEAIVSATIITEPDALSVTNLLRASNGSVKGDGTTIYAMANGDKGVGFYPVADGVIIPAGKCYLKATDATVEGRSFLAIDGEKTGISTMTQQSDTQTGVYNLSGQRVEQPQKGIYIQNGRKVVVK